MIAREAVPLSSLTTLRVGGPARYVIDIEDAAILPEAIAFAHERSLPFIVLGGGSNMLAPDAGYEGVVLCMRTAGIVFAGDGMVEVTASAGVPWDDLVQEASARGLWGIENLAGIPGTVGAAPVQNIGAYGVEFESAFVRAVAYDRGAGKFRTFTRDECGFRYRDSRFKQERDFIITEVTLRLSPDGEPQVGYSDLARLCEAGELLDTPARIMEAVRAIRARKFPDLTKEGSAGSFFKNPIISEAEYEALSERFAPVILAHGPIPRYPLQESGVVKIPLAYFLDKALGLRGYKKGHAHLFHNQPLVLVTEDGATAEDVNALADDVAKKIHDAIGLSIEREVRDLN